MRESKVYFNSGNLKLEGYLVLPADSGESLCPGVLLCHPHPLYGGSMDNNIIINVSHFLAAAGIANLRFNFRGVGRSQGSFAEGIGELEDAYGALAFLSREEGIDGERLGVMGYSFGGMIAFSLGVESARIKAMAGVSPIVPPGLLENCSKPTLIIYGSDDAVVPPSTFLPEVEKMAVSAEIEVFKGGDHFWWGYEKKVAEKVTDFFARHLGVKKC